MRELNIEIMGRLLVSSLLFVMSAGVAVAYAQEPAQATPPEKKVDFAIPLYKVEHDHRIGSGKGELRITETGIEYRGEGKDESRHNHVWSDADIKRLEMSKTELHIIAYEAARIPLIPRKVPFVHEQALHVGSERQHSFRLLGGEITPDLVRALLARFNRPIATTVIPKEDEESGPPLFEIPVFHRHRAGGESGVLRAYQRHMYFEANDENHSHYWRYSDIRDIGNLGRYRFEIATYEGQFGTDGKSYIFDLKRPMTSPEFDALWKKVYENGRDPRLSPTLNQKKEP